MFSNICIFSIKTGNKKFCLRPFKNPRKFCISKCEAKKKNRENQHNNEYVGVAKLFNDGTKLSFAECCSRPINNVFLIVQRKVSASKIASQLLLAINRTFIAL